MGVIAAVAALMVCGCGAGGRGEIVTPAAVHGLSVYPLPGTRTASPSAAISIRGTSASHLAAVRVSGSRTGVHTGHLVAHSDHRGASFVPDQPFAAGERVTVRVGRPVVGVTHGVVRFTVRAPVDLHEQPQHASPVHAGVARFKSRPDLAPPAIQVRVHRRGTAPGDIFVAPKAGASQNGPMILDPRGRTLFFDPLPGDLQATDFRVQRYRGKPVLTWWQGTQSGGHGVGAGVIVDRSYQRIATVKAANGYQADFHEFTLTDHDTALLDISNPVRADLRSVGGPKDGVVFDDVVEEIDVKTGMVLFEWHSLGHVPLSASYRHYKPGKPYEYFHINSVDELSNGNLLISSRETWAVYELDRATGRIVWKLGGKHSTFRIGHGARFSWQHDARGHRGDVISVFDNHSVRPTPGATTTGMVIRLDLRHHRARLAHVYRYPLGPKQSPSQGNTQLLPDGHVFMGWGGNNANFSEFSRTGKLLFDARFASPRANSYRAYRNRWRGVPARPPAVAAVMSGGRTTVYASWNGATDVARWRVLSGPSADGLTPGPAVAWRGFETRIRLPAPAALVQVQALGARGRVLASSNVEPAAG